MDSKGTFEDLTLFDWSFKMRLKYWPIILCSVYKMIYLMACPQDNNIAIISEFSFIILQILQKFLDIILYLHQLSSKKFLKKMFLKVHWWSVAEDWFRLCINWTPNRGPQEIFHFRYFSLNYNPFCHHCWFLFMSSPQPERLWEGRK